MTRVIAGTWGGRRLVTPKGPATRPTSDRVRESLFTSLASQLGSLDGLTVLDLFAGSGALGIEAASRGATQVDVVESDQAACKAITTNISTLNASGIRLHRTTVERFVAAAGTRYDLVLLDPPYEFDVGPVLAQLPTLLTTNALVVVERSARDAELHWPDGLVGVRDKAYGETQLWYGQPQFSEGVPS